jgi:hypothetical protein
MNSAGSWKETVVITDLTKMRENRVCVAGLNRKCECVRPVLPYAPITTDHLERDGKALFSPRHVLEFSFSGRKSNPPHTEDCIFDPCETRLIKVLTNEQMKRVLAKSCFGCVDEIFGESLVGGKYLKPGSGQRSIGTVRAKIMEIDLTSQRMSFVDESGQYYPHRKITDLAFHVFASDCLESREQSDKDAAENLLKKFQESKDMFVRVGLTRPWVNPASGVEGCWLQVTGIYSFPDYSCASRRESSNQRSEIMFQKLRRLRRAMAKKERVPPYLIFHDKVLREIAEKTPRSLDEFRMIPGIGQKKAERYGIEVLKFLKNQPRDL